MTLPKFKASQTFNPQVEFTSTEDSDLILQHFCCKINTAGRFIGGYIVPIAARNAWISCKAVDFIDSQKGCFKINLMQPL